MTMACGSCGARKRNLADGQSKFEVKTRDGKTVVVDTMQEVNAALTLGGGGTYKKVLAK